MKWASAISQEERLNPAMDEALAGIHAGLDGASPHLGLVFCSPHHRPEAESVVDRLIGEFPGSVWIGCSGRGIIGNAREVMEGAAVSLTAAHLPDVTVHPFHLAPTEVPMPGDSLGFWRRRLGESGPDSNVIVLPDPFSCDVQQLVGGLDAMLPSHVTVGGLASGGEAPDENFLFVNQFVHRQGAVGVSLAGNVEVETIVAQGCRPIGNPLFVTGTSEPFITELDGRKPLAVLEDLFEHLSPEDKELFRFSLSIGLVMQPDQVEYGRGDFLIRNLAGVEPESGAVAVGANVEKGQVVQFHLRDAATSAEDLAAHLDAYSASATVPPSGALLFSCLGRGEFLYGEPDHDSNAFARAVGPVPLTGFFCNGEIGPVGGTTYLHGYTSVFALFRPTE
jgi:small ligand-binding sensory domain FIST